MKRGRAQFCVWASAFGVCCSATAATDPFLQLSSPILTNGQVQFTLTGESGVSYVIESSTDTQNWSPLVTNNEIATSRIITQPASNGPAFHRAGRALQPVFSAAFVARQSINLRGNNLMVSSYDSADPAHDNPIDPNEIKAGGGVYCEGDLLATNAIIRGKVNVAGLLAATNAIIGDLAWTNAGTIQPGWYQNDYRFVSADVTPPYTTGSTPGGGGGTNYWILTASGSPYYTNGTVKTAGSSRTILITGGVVSLYVTGDFRLSSNWEIKIEPGSTFKLYVGKPSGTNNICEFGSVNPFLTNVMSFQCYGLPTTKSVVWAGNNAFQGVIFAPQATFTTGGGGNRTYDFQGACVADSVIINGHFNFHYDENLMRNGPKR